MSLFRDLLNKDNATSTMRFIFIFIIILSVVDVLAMWTILSVLKGTMLEIPATVSTFVGSLVAIITAGKWLEKREEVKNGSNNNVIPKEL